MKSEKPTDPQVTLDSSEPLKQEQTNQEKVQRSRDHVEKLLKLKSQKDDWSFCKSLKFVRLSLSLILFIFYWLAD